MERDTARICTFRSRVERNGFVRNSVYNTNNNIFCNPPDEQEVASASRPTWCTHLQIPVRRSEWLALAEEYITIWRPAGRTVTHGRHTVLSEGGVGTVVRSTPWPGQGEWLTNTECAWAQEYRLWYSFQWPDTKTKKERKREEKRGKESNLLGKSNRLQATVRSNSSSTKFDAALVLNQCYHFSNSGIWIRSHSLSEIVIITDRKPFSRMHKLLRVGRQIENSPTRIMYNDLFFFSSSNILKIYIVKYFRSCLWLDERCIFTVVRFHSLKFVGHF